MFEPEVLAAIISSSVAVFTALCSFIVSFLKSRKVKQEIAAAQLQTQLIDEYLDALEAARAYIVCPDCGREISVSDTTVNFKAVSEVEKALRAVKANSKGDVSNV